MDEKQLYYEFISIISERHPGLTLEEYTDSCVYLLFYHYLCLRYDTLIDDSIKIDALVKMAIRGKLHVDSFLHFMKNASGQLLSASGEFELSDFAYYHKLKKVKLLEKQKSYARFIRKLVKKIHAWECDSLLLKQFPVLFERLLLEFSRMKKETYLSADMFALYSFFFNQNQAEKKKLLLPDFRFGVLLSSMMGSPESTYVYGCEDNEDYMEILRILCYMKGIPSDQVSLSLKDVWREHARDYFSSCDCAGIFMPEGVDGGTLLAEIKDMDYPKEMLNLKSKGELPLLLSMLAFLKKKGMAVVVYPSALLYREGREMQIRRYLLEELNCLDTVMLLPEHLFHSTGQDEVLLFLQKDRDEKDVMFFDCSKVDAFDEDTLAQITKALSGRKTVSNFCSSVSIQAIAENDYNLNLPRYIVHPEEDRKVDMEAKLKRIAEIDRELQEIETRILMYRRDLNLTL